MVSGLTVVAVSPDAKEIKELMHFINAKLSGRLCYYGTRTIASGLLAPFGACV
jgi:hypothetical protein